MNKYEWLEAVMASKLSPGTKVFAFGLFKHMDKSGTCFPGEDALAEVTRLSRGHFATYRRVLRESGWVVMEGRKTKNGDSYTYSTPETAPNGEQTASYGEQTAPNGDESAPVGGVNTVSNTTSNPSTNPSKEEAPVVADAPTVTYELSFESEVRETETEFSCLRATVPDGPVGDYNPLNFEEVETPEGFRYFLSLNGVTKSEDSLNSVEPEEDFWTRAEKNIAEIGTGRMGGRTTTLVDEEW